MESEFQVPDSKQHTALAGIKELFYSLRPRFRDWHFWAVQVLVVGIAAVHDVIEIKGFLPHLGMLYFLPISMFFVPVAYAALNFGILGSIATAVWVLIITIPNWVFWHQGFERLGSASPAAAPSHAMS